LLTGYGLWKRSWLGFAGAWFFIILAPSSSFMPLLDPIFEYRMYLPLISVLVVAVFGGYGLLQRVQSINLEFGLPAALTTFLAASVILTFATLTLRRNEDYRSPVAMWSDVVAQRPFNRRAHVNLGLALREVGRPEEALSCFRAAYDVDPDYELAYVYLMAGLRDAGLWEEALRHTQEVLDRRLGSVSMSSSLRTGEPMIRRDGYTAMAHHYLGVIRLEQGQIEDALDDLQKGIDLRPQYPLTHAFFAGALLKQARREEAGVHCRFARARDPQWSGTFNHWAYQLVLKEAPSGYDVRRAVILAELACFASEDQEAQYLDTLAIAYGLAGRVSEAKTMAEKALARATATNQVFLAKEIRQRLDGYNRQRPFGYAYRTT
jgi:tetratricopeptide (TPR) repeat protein